jgi:parvulin-like peptidyl-prolyl isomerase
VTAATLFRKSKFSPTDKGCQRIIKAKFFIRWPHSSVGGFVAAFITGLSFILIGCGKKTDSSPLLARVEKATISQRQYEQRFKNLTMLTPIDNAPMREALLQAMIDEQVLLIEADRRGLRETEEFKRRAEAIRLDAMLEAYRDSMVDTVTAREAEIKEAFALANEQAAARHLYAPTLAEANALHEKLQNGATFEELAPTVFKDYRLASSGGYLGYFKWDDMDPTFSATAQKLRKGEISKPVRTKYGYSIIKLEDRVRSPILTETQYGQQRKKLKWVTAHRKRARMIQQLDAKTLADLKIQFNEATLAQMWEKMQRAKADTALHVENGVDSAALSPTAEVATIGGQTWTVKDFQARALQTSARQRSRVQSVEDLKDFIVGLALRDEYLRRAKRAGFEKNPQVQQTIREHKNGFLVEKMKSLLTDSVRVPVDSLYAAYLSQPQNYVHPAMVRLREITVANRQQSEYIFREAKRGVEFAGLARRYSIRKWSAERGGEVGYVAKGDLGALAEQIFKLKAGEIGGPYQQGEYFMIVQVLDIKPSLQKTFEEAKAEIEENLLPTYRQRELEKQLEILRRPLQITVDQRVLQQVKSPL